MWNFCEFGQKIAILDDCGNSLSYEELDKIGNILCGEIAEENKDEARCLVFNMCDNVMGSIVGYVSFLNGTVVPVMLKHDLDEDLLIDLYTEYMPAYVWAPKADLYGRLFSGLKVVYEAFDYVLLKTPFDKKAQLSDDLGLLLTTSGSTGSPKFVRQSYSNIRANIDSIVEYLHLDETERPITTLPMNYTYGISIINTHLDVGATILLTDKTLMQREFWDFFKREGATSFGGVPYTYEMLKRLRFMRMDLPSLRTMTQAGGKLLPELHKEFAEYAQTNNKEFVVMYGACEATARMGWLPPQKALDKQGSMGIAIPGGRFELIDTNNQVFDIPNQVGELVYYGNNVTLGYATSASDLQKPDERFGKYVTGDMAMKDEEGFYYIVGRKKRFLKIYGNRVNLDDCERMLKEEFHEDLACGGVDDKLYIFGIEERNLPLMKKFLVAKTGLNAVAFKTIKVDSIPHNESGKTIYKDLSKYYV
ncbi:AMP-binding protein [Ruminococcus sp. OA3]|uniref:AMP-binding protein n=1 Tax=Ruminococcus sp. OA3 TaxID=2914164 RepID=UPI001F06123A|nr:AMP-binding protein [Ruminococcus sp. OA3]MCH1982914.1 AMP-binding protein [Ruminococcus sp. OA3]